MVPTWILLAAAAAAAVAVGVCDAAAAKKPSVQPNMVADGGGGGSCDVTASTGLVEYDSAYCSGDEWEEPEYDAWTEYGASRCKTRIRTNYSHNIFGQTLWGYRQRLNFCWNGSRITYVDRQRFSLSCCYLLWEFKGHVYNSCATEFCHEKKGGWSAYIATQGSFQACYTPWGLCQTVISGIAQQAYGNGSMSSWSF